MSTIPKMAYMSRDSRFHITNPNTLNTVYANGGENTTQKKTVQTTNQVQTPRITATDAFDIGDYLPCPC